MSTKQKPSLASGKAAKKSRHNPNLRKQTSIVGSKSNMTIVPKHEVYKDALILLDDKIYGKNQVPEVVKDSLFVYQVVSYDYDAETFTAAYQKRTIRPDGNVFTEYIEDEEETLLPGISIDNVVGGAKLYRQALNRVHRDEDLRKAAAAKVLEEKSKGEVDVSDIMAIAKEKGKLVLMFLYFS